MFHDLYPYLNTNPSSVERKIEIFQQNIISCTLFDTFKVNYPVSGSKSVQYIKKIYHHYLCKVQSHGGMGQKKLFQCFCFDFCLLVPIHMQKH